MRGRKTFRTSVVALALAIFGFTAVCPGQCVSAVPAQPADDCHRQEPTPAADASSVLPCCASVMPPKGWTHESAGAIAPVLLSATGSPALHRGTAPPAGSHTERPHSPAPRALYLRSHAFLI